MTVGELIAALQALPQDAPVKYIYDGEPRIDADLVWLARNGTAIICGGGEPIYNPEVRPAEAPGKEVLHWETPGGYNDDEDWP